MKRGIALLSVFGLAVTAMGGSPPGQPASDAAARAATPGNGFFSSQAASVTALVNEKFATGKTNPADLAGVVQTIHDLILKNLADGNREELGKLYLLDAHVYGEGLSYTSTAQRIWMHVARTFPGTAAAQEAKTSLAQLAAQRAAEAAAPPPPPRLQDGEPPEIGKLAPDFAAEDINGKTVKLSDYRGKIVVLETHNARCGGCIHAYGAGGIQAVQRDLAAKGVVWLIIDPGGHNVRVARRTPEEAKEEWASLNTTITDWIIDDPEQSFCRKYFVAVTPQMFVIDKSGALAYTGALDNQLAAPGGSHPGGNYVRNAVEELLAGKPVSVPHVKPSGCPILYSDGFTTAETWRRLMAEPWE